MLCMLLLAVTPLPGFSATPSSATSLSTFRMLGPGDDASSQKEISHVLVSLLLQRDTKTIERHLQHAC